jgi:phosphoribosylglycinamide formyltransferase 1
MTDPNRESGIHDGAEGDDSFMIRLGVLASHEGSLLQTVIDACGDGTIQASVGVVISNNSGSGALRRARAAGIATAHLSAVTHPDDAERDAAIVATLARHRVDWVLLAGYMKKLGPEMLSAYAGRILNTHPALLPNYGGRGFYGRRVHEAVLSAGDRQSGASVHLVEGEYDTGPVIASVPVCVAAEDTPERLEARVKVAERKLLIDVLGALAQGKNPAELAAQTHSRGRR